MFNKKNEIKEDPTKPEEAPVTPEIVPPAPDFVDRSNYNCENCGGNGLVRDEGNHKDVICPQCNGKGHLR